MSLVLVAIDLASAVFVAVSLLSQFSDRSNLKSTKALRHTTILALFWLLIEAAAYSLNGPQFPQALLWTLNLLAYTGGCFVFVLFVRYCWLYISERTSLSRWVLMVPVVGMIVNAAIIVGAFLSGGIITFEKGYAVIVGGVPALSQLLNIVLLVYVPLVAFSKRKAIGGKAVSLLGLYGFAPIIAIVVVLATGLDLTVSLGAVAVVVVASLLQKDEARERIEEANVRLEKANSELLQVTAEQEAQLEEISALNNELEDHQARLEESASEQEVQLEEITALNTELEEFSAEQEAQLEEIASLNDKLREKQHFTDVLYHRLMKVQSCGVVAYTVPGREVLVMNDRARAMYGLPLEGELDDELLLRRISKARYDDEGTIQRLRSIKKPGDQYSFTFWIKGADDVENHVYVTTQLVQIDDGDLVVVSSLLDISEITRMERDTAIANAANAAKTAFLFNMSHDIRTPMNAILGYADLMERHFDDGERCRDYLDKIKRSSDFLLSLINNVLEMARIESGKATLDEVPCEISEVCLNVSSVYEGLMSDKGITFAVTSKFVTPRIYCDRVKMNEVFLNLLSNAYKYTPAGGSVSMDVVELPSDREGYVLVQATVSDTGIGMSKDYLPVLFEEFSRERSSTEAGVQGTGLGMPIVKKLIDLMGGTIEVESEFGRGTTFVVTIPHRIADEVEVTDEGGGSIDPEAFVGKRVLLAEDNDINAEIATEVLQEFGFIVERAEDGAVCVGMLRDAEPGRYDVVLMDVQMPNMDGYEATRAIRAFDDPGKAAIPIVAMTANAFEEDKRAALDAGMNGHLAKPIDVPKLMETLAGILG